MIGSYQTLGLSENDVSLLEKYQLTYLLDKIKDQQQELEQKRYHLENVLSKIQKDLSAARDAQMSLLPKDLLGVPQIEYAARFYPSQYVSGDIYNIFRLDENNIGVYNIDISGHGVPAALFSVSLSQMLSTNISNRNLLKVPAKEPPFYRINPPDTVIQILNEDSSFNRFGFYFTMVYMIINIKDKTIRYARAGHNPPIIIREDGDVEMPSEGGLPIGWDFPREDTVVELKLNHGDRIFLFSDGITEAANDIEVMYSTDRLVDILRKSRELPIDESLRKLIKNLQDFTGSNKFDDDVSIIGLQFL